MHSASVPIFHDRRLLLDIVVIPCLASRDSVAVAQSLGPYRTQLHIRAVEVLPDVRHLMDENGIDAPKTGPNCFRSAVRVANGASRNDVHITRRPVRPGDIPEAQTVIQKNSLPRGKGGAKHTQHESLFGG